MLRSPRRLLVLDDDPTGSQCVHDVSVAFEEDAELLRRTLAEPGSTCFVLTNTRALGEDQAVAANRRIVEGMLGGAEGAAPEGLHVVSRSDSTLRGHVIAEPNAIADVLEGAGRPVDAFLFCPAMIEAGRYTREDVHYAVVQGEELRVEETDFAQDATFGYSHSDLREFLEEKSGGEVPAGEVLSVTLEDIREGGVERVAEILAGASGRRWVVVNACEYSDMEVVADAVTELEARGRVFVTRCGPSFVRPLAGQEGARVLGAEEIRAAEGAPGADAAPSAGTRAEHGLVVVGSHVGLTTRQLRAVQERGTLTEFELDVARLLDESSREAHIEETVAAIREELGRNDCVVYTSRERVSTDDPDESLAIARSVSDAVVRVVAEVRGALPAWVVAKGGITSHEVAHRGLGIRLATVAGQFFPGQISLFRPDAAPEETLGCPYVVFPGNVGGEQALADVVDRLRSVGR
ncbi:four-carbon acid sugar kinase family protein [Rothia halotolerans]|uniref:four-carbon acid sugar kinase family protein n=1 Tax=Rothia halotolerans TaxID=405770 RepID=UPI00101C30FD|nr:four-carbon acid sugar kinase family protein [Rothia halotolerans]